MKPSTIRDVRTADPAQTRDALADLRPGLLPGYDAALPGARAAVLARLLGALHREPLAGIAEHAPGPLNRNAEHTREPLNGITEHTREPLNRSTEHGSGARVVVALDDGRILSAPAAAAEPFHPARAGLAADLDGVAHTDPGALLRALALPGRTARLAAELDNSVANLALARAAARHVSLRDATGDPDGPGRLEQQPTDGHPLHPCCRTRGAMSVADVLAYAPEHHPVLRLRRLRVPPERWHGAAEPVLLAHPWQAERLLERYPWLTGDGATGPVRPLMSLRTVAPLDGGPHLKTAVEAQLTSAVRTVSPAAVHNGPVLSRLLREVTRDLPLDVLAEYGAGAVLIDGVPQRHLAHLRRAAPRPGPGQVVLPLAALAGVLDEAVDDPYAWLSDLAGLLFPALLTVLERGVALEAHGQNTLVLLDAGRPARILYRDLGGVRVSARRLRAAGFDAPPLLGDLPTDDDEVLRDKLAAAAYASLAGELVALLSRRRGAEPDRLWRIVAAAGRGTADGRLLLRRARLPVKATTAMRLAADPLDDRWAGVDNPLAVHG